jgi:hypothetical protein
MPSQPSYAFGPNNANAAVSSHSGNNNSNSHNPFIQPHHSPNPQSRSLTPGYGGSGGGNSPLLSSYDRRDSDYDMSGNQNGRLLGAGGQAMSRQGSADSGMMDTVSFLIRLF